MESKREELLKNASFFRLLWIYVSPFALRAYLEKVPAGGDEQAKAGVHYRNSLFIFSRIDKYIDRWSSVIWGCFVGMAILTFALPWAVVYLIVSVVMMVAIIHVGVIGVYRHVLNDRIDKYAKILGVTRPKARDEPKQFPRD